MRLIDADRLYNTIIDEIDPISISMDGGEMRGMMRTIIAAEPTVPAVPLEMISKKLGSLCKPCLFQTVGCPSKSFDCDSCNTSDAWEKAIIKWMEEEDAQKEN